MSWCPQSPHLLAIGGKCITVFHAGTGSSQVIGDRKRRPLMCGAWLNAGHLLYGTDEAQLTTLNINTSQETAMKLPARPVSIHVSAPHCVVLLESKHILVLSGPTMNIAMKLVMPASDGAPINVAWAGPHTLVSVWSNGAVVATLHGMCVAYWWHRSLLAVHR